MRTILTFIKAVVFGVLVFSLHSCREEGIVSEKVMAAIVADMYLADQVLDVNPHLKLQTDSLLLYPAIMERHGCSVEMYDKSMKYYMLDGERYNDILKAAKVKLAQREKELNTIIKENHYQIKKSQLVQWWAIDSVRSVNPEEFLYDKFLRSVRWFVMMDHMKQPWTLGDSAVVDIPQNPQWWINNVVAPKREYKTIIIRKQTENNKESKEDEKDSGKLRVSLREKRTLEKWVPDSE